MNKLHIAFGAIAVLLSTPVAADVSESQRWTKTYPVSAATPRLSIDNIWGSIRVRPGADGEIRITVDETRTASDQAMFNRSLDLLNMETVADTYGVSIVVGDNKDRWRYRDHCDGCRVQYEFEVYVPAGTLLDVGTVIDGKVDVAGVYGSIDASNVNGPISLADVRDCGAVESVNGEVALTFSGSPSQPCSINTINGRVSLAMPAGSGLDVALDIVNGRVTSEFAVDSFSLPASVEYDEAEGARRYRLQQSAGLRLESGGPTFNISSMNGDIRFLKTKEGV